jgi:putative ABC transport system substrate-binding protein
MPAMPSRFFVRRMILTTLASLVALVSSLSAFDKKEFKVYIVSDDNTRNKFIDLRNGFTDSLDKQLSAAGSKADYTVFDTKGSKATVSAIIQAIKDGSPDLIAVINNSGVFADTNITLKLGDPKYRFVSENCVPVQSGVAKTWDKPGGNVTGVGVFTQFTSIIRLAKLVNPGYRRLYFWTWDSPATAALNDYFLAEIKSACKATGIELAEFKKLKSAEEQFEYMLELDKKGSDVFAVPGLSVWVHRDGSPANMAVEETEVWLTKMRRLPIYAYDEVAVKAVAPAGACVVWYDLGAQMADKAMKVLGGANPGDIAWSYPRKYNVMFNLAGAKLIGLEIPEPLIMGAYRVYTDFEGNFAGQKN